MRTKLVSLKIFLASLVASLIVAAGCGSSGSSNVVKVAVSPAAFTVIVTQTLTLTSIVTGTTNTNVTWACTYATSFFDSNNKQQTGTSTACNDQSGNIPANSANTTVVFTAPQSLPDLTKLQGTNCTSTTTTCTLVITITATSAADTKATGTGLLNLDSGISVILSPTTATVPTSANSSAPSQFQFSATLTNDIGTVKGVTWLVTQATPSGTTNYPDLASCSPTCGSIDGNGLYSAPTTIPTTATLTVVVTSKADPLRFAIGTITVIAGGPITFKGISPTIVPQGVAFFDIYLEAPGVTSASQVAITGDVSGQQPVLPAQLKVLFPLPTSTTPAPASTGFRVRLLAGNLAAVDNFTVSVTDPSQPVTTSGPGPYRYSVVPVRATTVASLPDSIVQNVNAQSNELNMIVNGGYFGPQGGFVAGGVSFNGTTIPFSATDSTSRQLLLTFPSNLADNSQPGLYPFSVVRTAPGAPPEDNPSVTNLAIFPDYRTGTPSFLPPPLMPVTAGTAGPLKNPSAIDIDQDLGIAAVADTGNNQVVFFKINADHTLTPYGTTTVVGTPTSVSVNHTLHTVVVVGNSDQNVYVFPIPQTPNASLIAPTTTISLGALLPSELSPLPTPYSVGVDPDTNRAIVAYSSTANPTTAKVGFLLDLNTGDTGTAAAPACLKIPGQATTVSPCVSAQVTLNTGTAPQIAMLPHSHLAVVTPGGLGITSGIDVTKSSTSVGIANVSLTSGLVTVTTASNHGLNPGNPGTVLILGVPKGTTNQVDFNGAFTVLSVINSTSFTYALTATVNDTATGNSDSNVYYGTPNISIGGLSQTTQGVAVNPITGLVAMADPNSTGTNGAQINFLSSLDQNVTSIIFHADCTVYSTNCTNSPELPGTAVVSFQPFTNELVSYNAQLNQLSISNPVTLALGRYSLQTLPSGTGQGSVGSLSLSGGLAVDGATNQALIVQSGSSSIWVANLGPVPSTVQKAVHISEVLVPSADGVNPGGIKGANFPQGTLTSANALTGVKIFGAGFGNSPVVRLDGTPLAAPTVISDRQLQVDIPASFLKHPHRYALDVIAGGVQSNASDFFVVAAVDLSQVCKDSSNNSLTHPSSVAIADQLGLQGFAPKAVVTNTGCNSISVIDIAPQLPTYDTTNPNKPVFTGFADNANFGMFKVITVGSGPTGVAISGRLGVAVVSNNTAGTASIIDLVGGKAAAADVTTGTGPIGVAVNDATLAGLVANTGSNTLSQLNLSALSSTTATPVTTIAVDTEPIAIAIDQDRGTNNLGLAVVTALRLNSAALPSGVLDSVDIGIATPAKSTTAAIGSVTATPTGIVFDPSVSPALFYAVSSGGNVVSSFNPDNGVASVVHVGINPTSLGINPQTGAVLTLNSISNTVSIIDTLTSPFKTRRSYGLPGSPTLGVAIDQFLNLAVIVDQANNRVFIFPMPN